MEQLIKLVMVMATLIWTVIPAFAADSSAEVVVQSPSGKDQLMQRLESAKQGDWAAANDPTVSPIRQGTFLNQMNKVNRAIDELNHGFTPSQSEINDALWAPPTHISPAERAQLIEQLKQARQQDDRNEQQMLNDLAWSRSDAPADTAKFDQRKQQVDQVIKNLEIGAPIRWSAIKEALVVPASPY